MSEVFDVVLLFALPASGKSEVRRLLSSFDSDRLQKEFHIGDNLQLDDFPYVFLMRQIDDTLAEMGEDRIYYDGETPFRDGRDWATLTTLLNEDYYDMINRNIIEPESAAEYLFQRLERASLQVGIAPRLTYLKEETRKKLANRLEEHCQKMLQEKYDGYPQSFDNKTIIIEMARGGETEASMPLKDPAGYQYTLRHFCPEILSKAAIMYIEVTPEESRKKNRARFNPDDPGSIISHGTPEIVMEKDYGCDDVQYLKSISEKEDALTVEAYGRKYYLPIGIFNNMPDKTTFLRTIPEHWNKQLVEDITALVKSATDTMWKNYKK